MTPTEVLDLAILGVVSDGGLPLEAVVKVVKRIGGPRFRPTAEVIAARVGALVEAGCLVPPGDDQEARLGLSEAGRAGIQRLLRRGGDAPGEALGAVCQTLRLCLLELLPP